MKKSRLTFFDLLIRLLALILAIALLLGCIAGNIDPRENKFIPFFGLAYPYLLVLNVLMVFWWLIRRRWSMMLLTVVIIAVGWQVVLATFRVSGEGGAGPKKDSTELRMMTYNVHNFSPFDDDQDPLTVKSNILKVIRQENPDVIAIQEYFTRYEGPLDMTDSIKAILHTKHYYFEASFEAQSQATGLAIFSKYPIRRKGSILFPGNHGGNAAIFVDLLANKKVMRIYNVHLQSISFDPQDYAYLDKVKKEMDPELRPSKRILSMLRTAFMKRSEQVDILKSSIKECKTPYLIAGDFNDTPASYAVTQLTKNLNRSFEKEGVGFGRTYNGKFPNFQIDYIATTKDINIVNHRVIDAKLSDHFPVRSDLRLTP
jgi:endonuclease/exonuclease/phosphatase family metal-dependent hydrolase